MTKHSVARILRTAIHSKIIDKNSASSLLIDGLRELESSNNKFLCHQLGLVCSEDRARAVVLGTGELVKEGLVKSKTYDDLVTLAADAFSL